MDLPSLSSTQALAHRLVEILPQQALLLLVGELGAGKTTLTQFIVSHLGSEARVSSPSYTLIHEYDTQAGLVIHIDAYRLASAQALFQLGLEDYLDRARLVIVEWGRELLEHFPEAWLLVIDFDGERRRVLLEHAGKKVIG